MIDLPDKQHFRIEEVAVYWDVSVRAIYTWIQHNKVKKVKIGGATRITREQVLNPPFPTARNGTDAERSIS